MIDDRMFDFPDYYRRIAKDLSDNCTIVEVGVADGNSALFLAKELHLLGKKFKLYMVDNMDYGKYEQMKTIYQNIIASGLAEFIEVMPYDSVVASQMFNDNSLHFVFLDSSHLYEETKAEIRNWYPKLFDGGILSGHDYIGCPSVGKAVDEVIPVTFTRPQLDETIFEPVNVLSIYPTDKNFGIWECKKDWFIKLN